MKNKEEEKLILQKAKEEYDYGDSKRKTTSLEDCC